MTDTPPDWVLIEAAKRGGRSWNDHSVKLLRDAYVDVDVPVFNALCDMILKHEQKPVDRKLLCAREACANVYMTMEEGYQSRVYDDLLCVKLALRAIELWEEGFGK